MLKSNFLTVSDIILNNQFLGMVRQWQELFHQNRYSFVDITSPDYIKLADAYNIAGKKVDQRSVLKSTLTEILSHNNPFLLEVMVGKENNVFPMVPQGRGVSEIILSKEEL